MVSTPVRIALRDAIAEEMRKNLNIFLIGEEVGEYEGAYKVSQGLLAEFGPKRIVSKIISLKINAITEKNKIATTARIKCHLKTSR